MKAIFGDIIGEITAGLGISAVFNHCDDLDAGLWF